MSYSAYATIAAVRLGVGIVGSVVASLPVHRDITAPYFFSRPFLVAGRGRTTGRK